METRDLVLVALSLIAWIMAYFVYNMQAQKSPTQGEYLSLDELFLYFRKSIIGVG